MTFSEQYGQHIGLLKIVNLNTGSSFEDLFDTFPKYLFAYDGTLQRCICPNLIEIPDYLCYNCTNLEYISFPNATKIGCNAFSNCAKISNDLSFPNVTQVKNGAFSGCNKIKKIEFDALTIIESNAFAASGSGSLSTFIIKNPDIVPTMQSHPTSYTFKNNHYKLTFYVPDALIEDYKSATNWSIIADKIKPLSELPEEE